MGVIRFLLAFIVLQQHAGGTGYFETVGGMAAVQAFFVISGFYTAAAYLRYYDGYGLAFWISRYCRLYPFYIFVVLATVALWAIEPRNDVGLFNVFLGDAPLFQNVSMIGLDLISVKVEDHFKLLVRQAWSIGAELVFYATLPWLLAARRFLPAMIVGAFALKVALLYKVGWQYAYFPFYGEIGYYMLGVYTFLHRDRLTLSTRWAWPLAVGFSIYVIMSPFASFELHSIGWNAAMTVAVSAVLPTCFAHLNGRVSTLLGDLSYGVYLVHLLCIQIGIDLRLLDFQTLTIVQRVVNIALVTAMATAVTASFEFLVQRRMDKARRKYFYRSQVSVAEAVIDGGSVKAPPGSAFPR